MCVEIKEQNNKEMWLAHGTTVIDLLEKSYTMDEAF
jgi:hypothetical protein